MLLHIMADFVLCKRGEYFYRFLGNLIAFPSYAKYFWNIVQIIYGLFHFDWIWFVALIIRTY